MNSRIVRLVAVVLACVMAVSSCTGTSTVSKKATDTGPQPSATQPAAASTVVPTATASPKPTEPPSRTAPPPTKTAQPRPTQTAAKPTVAVTPTVAATPSEDAQNAYKMLILLDACTAMLEETAAITPTADASEQQAGASLAIGMLLGMASQAIAEPCPAAELQPAWEEASIALPLVTGVFERWSNKEITADQVPAALAPAKKQVERTLRTAEEALVRAYGGDLAQMQKTRQQTIAELRASLVAELSQTPTPSAGEGEQPPTAGTPGIEITDISTYNDSFGDTQFIGLIRNKGRVPVSQVKVTVSLLDGEGKIMATDSGMAFLDLIPAGGTSPFRVDFFEDAGPFDKFEAVAQGTAADSFVLEGTDQRFSLGRERVKKTDEGSFALVGEAVNRGDNRASMVEAVVVAYGAGDKVVGVGSSYAEQDIVDPGQAATFNVDLAVTGQVVSHTVQIEANVQSEEEPRPKLKLSPLTQLQGSFGPSFVGELANLSEQPVESAKVVITLADAKGQLLASESGNALLDVIPPGAVAPVEISFSDEIAPKSVMTVTVEGNVAGQFTLADNTTQFELVQQSKKTPEEGRLAVVGQVRNSGEKPAEQVEVIVTAYDARKRVIGVGSGYAELDPLAPGALSPFSVELAVGGVVADVKIQVQGRRGDS